MILQFIKRDPAWKFTPWFTAAAALGALFYSARPGGWLPLTIAGPVYLILWMLALPHQRVTFFEAALPVSGRDLFLARFLSLLAMIWLPAVATVAILLAGSKAAAAPQIAVVATILTLGTIINLSVRIKEFTAPPKLTLWCASCTTGAVIPALGFRLPILVAAICGGAAFVVAEIAWRSVPKTFQSAPWDVATPRRNIGNAAPSLPWWPIIRSLFPWQSALFIPVGTLFAATGQWIFAPMYLMMAYSQTRQTTRWTLALPISSRRMFAASTIPMLLVLAFGAEFGALSGMARQGHDLIRQGDPEHFRGSGALDVFVNRAFWRLAPGGQVPVIQAPWGERFQPEPHPVLGLTLYNPYAVGEKNSFAFEDWQFSRATEYIYGRAMTARQLAEGKGQGLTPITLRPRMQILTIAAILASALFWVWLIELFSWQWLGRLSKTARTALTYSAMLIIIGGVFGDLLVSKLPGSLSQPVLEAGLLYISRHLPANLGVVALVAFLPLAAMFWLIGFQVGVAENTQPVQQPQSLFDRLGSRP